MANLVASLAIHQPNHFDQNKVNASTTFYELGMDSYDVVDFMLQLEGDYQITFRDEDFFDVERLQDAVDIINEALRRK